MKKLKKLYSLAAVETYINSLADSADIDIIPGALIDTYVIHHDNGTTEIFEETYLNCWSSAYARHIYKKRIPNRFINALNENY